MACLSYLSVLPARMSVFAMVCLFACMCVCALDANLPVCCLSVCKVHCGSVCHAGSAPVMPVSPGFTTVSYISTSCNVPQSIALQSIALSTWVEHLHNCCMCAAITSGDSGPVDVHWNAPNGTWMKTTPSNPASPGTPTRKPSSGSARAAASADAGEAPASVLY